MINTQNMTNIFFNTVIEARDFFQETGTRGFNQRVSKTTFTALKIITAVVAITAVLSPSTFSSALTSSTSALNSSISSFTASISSFTASMMDFTTEIQNVVNKFFPSTITKFQVAGRIAPTVLKGIILLVATKILFNSTTPLLTNFMRNIKAREFNQKVSEITFIALKIIATLATLLTATVLSVILFKSTASIDTKLLIGSFYMFIAALLGVFTYLGIDELENKGFPK